MLKFVSKMAAFEEIPESYRRILNNFDLVNLDEYDRIRMERQWNVLVGDSDDDEEDFEGFEPEELYAPHDFVWTKPENQRDLFQFSDRIGHIRVLDGSRKALEYFQIFYSDEVLGKIVLLMNFNATIKRGRSNIGVWTDLTLEIILVQFYRILYIMDTMKERLVLLL